MIIKQQIKSLSLLLTLTLSNVISAQVLVSDADRDPNNPCDCAGAFQDGTNANFFDTGGSGADYSPNENEVITFCPDGNGAKMTLFTGTNIGFTWDVDASDTLYVFDGPTTASPLLAKGNTDSHPNGFNSLNTTSSWSNTSGCITIQFVSDASNEGTGWEGNVSCSNPWQPMELHIGGFIGDGESNGAGDQTDDMTNQMVSAMLPDTGYVNVCLGDSILFTNSTEYPYEPGGSMAPDAGGGYMQSGPTDHTTEWTFSDGTTFTGDSVWFTPSARTGYFVQMKVTDSETQYDIMNCKIRVSTIPSFETCRPVDSDICLGDVTRLIGGITPGDTAGVEATNSSFQIQGSFGAQTYLPDGSGISYTTDININGFPAGLTLQNPGDLESICISMEHSWLGDLEMMLTCPNGQDVMIFNAYSGNGLFPGGFGGGGTYVGGANDDGSTAIGVCEEYCFTDASSAIGTWANTFSTSTTTASGPTSGTMITPGDYNPEESFVSQLTGCPLNGTWTITVRDNQIVDNGYICEWGIFFKPTLNPDNETYTTSIVSEEWLPDGTILFGENDTAVYVAPGNVGAYGYTFAVEDNFGCAYDTTINVQVHAGPSVMTPDSTCDDVFPITGTYASTVGSASGGHWYYEGPDNLAFFPNTNYINPTLTASETGIYDLYFVDNFCNDTVNTSIAFLEDPVARIFGEDTVCQQDTAQFYTNTKFAEQYRWYNPSNQLISTDSAAIGEVEGEYTLVTTNFCNSDSAVINLVIQSCEVPNVITPNNDGVNDVFFTQYAEVYDDVNLIIYNRWGRVVYKTESYQNDWEGEKRNGKPLNGAVYFYVMTWDGGTKDTSGNITVFDK